MTMTQANRDLDTTRQIAERAEPLQITENAILKNGLSYWLVYSHGKSGTVLDQCDQDGNVYFPMVTRDLNAIDPLTGYTLHRPAPVDEDETEWVLNTAVRNIGIGVVLFVTAFLVWLFWH